MDDLPNKVVEHGLQWWTAARRQQFMPSTILNRAAFLHIIEQWEWDEWKRETGWYELADRGGRFRARGVCSK